VASALLVVELQRLQTINFTYGYLAGDEVLRAFAVQLDQILRNCDYIARISNDCFALLLTRVVNPGHAKLAAFKIQQLLEIPFNVKGEQVRCEAVVGLSLCPHHGTQSNRLLQAAEAGLQHAKRREEKLGMLGGADEIEISDNWDIEQDFSMAIERFELEAYYQPKILISGSKTIPYGAEALVRWNSPSRGIVPPNVFLPIAERMGLMKKLTAWMLNSAMRQSRNWSKTWGDLTVSVNIPPPIVSQPDFVDLVLSTKNIWEAGHISLCLEIVEQSMIEDSEVTFAKLKELREHGIKISIDDFGTGYSSLAYFRDIPTDELKIDRSFINHLGTDKANMNIVSLIIDLAHRFGLTVVAEGVEDQETMSILRDLQCDQIQGYYFSKPLAANDFRRWLHRFDAEALGV
jgi:diguanylate cyclase (GGDEF)-like protein